MLNIHVLRYVLPSFRHFKKVDEPHNISRETDANLKMWSKFGLLRYESGSARARNPVKATVVQGDQREQEILC
jgi:hypothetical protein